MAHNYVIQSVTHNGDNGVVVGTVDGVQVTATFWFSVLAAQPNALAGQTFLAGVLLAALPVTPAAVATYNGNITV